MAKLKIETRYATTPNDLLNHEKISLRAKGLFAFLQSKPDNWAFSIPRISAQTKEGKSAIRSALKELEESGYLRRKSTKNSEGKWAGYEYILSEKPSSEKRTTEKPTTENYNTLSKQDNSKKDIVNKNKALTKVKEQSYGNEEINWVIDKFEEVFGFPSKGTKDRFMAKHLLNNFNREQLEFMMRYCATDGYAPRVGSVEKLWFKKGDILAGIQSKKNQLKSNQKIIVEL